MNKSKKPIYYFVSSDGIGGMRLSTHNLSVYRQTSAVLLAQGYREATAKEYHEAVRKANEMEQPE